MTTHRAAGPMGRDIDLLNGGGELLDLGLLAARASAAGRRVEAGDQLDELDVTVLFELGELLRSAAKVVEFFGSGGQSGIPPTGAAAARLDVAINTVLGGAPASSESGVLAERFEALAAAIDTLRSTSDVAAAESLTQFFSALTESVLRETGSVGEMTTTL